MFLLPKEKLSANADPLAVELRNRELPGSSQRGFDIGISSRRKGRLCQAQVNRKLHDELPPAEQIGFRRAVDFSLERNRNFEIGCEGSGYLGSQSKGSSFALQTHPYFIG